MNKRCFESVDAALASLPRELEPARELWPGIAAGMRRSAPDTTARWSMALAASLALVSLVGALSWSILRERGGGTLSAPPAAALPGFNAQVLFEPPQSKDYVAAHAELQKLFEARLQLLAPATQVEVRADLETIRKANADIRAALTRDPASPLLLQLMRNTWQQEINLYTSVSQTTQPMLTRSTRS